ncbi:methyltransferase domain-containing protein [Aliiglaciecola sp. 3_MG-2023]|uniref:tRNA1(Val) (adenine(37)-N6)-methyltransferase n=1 Tax=Aliiglaciecola sp. 3_MG-2023 TaxID=3062644 RepID=UPI0026E42B4A|nr:methyltransferase domain-containing protein [Aliiglaciecola sp. 3_MG-2023]MDO6692179.1 methyltransferase domain-containing protein [Aliiglaciecola sp. 3_MG-2023]
MSHLFHFIRSRWQVSDPLTMTSKTKFNGFRFKQFDIEHENCAMKVGTDGILLGSWVANGHYSSILDIGTGSGLIAIMMAQRTGEQSQILGIDVDEKAVLQAQINAQKCPWQGKLSFQHISLQQLPELPQYDLIVSNPPYFQGKTGDLSISDPNYMPESRRQARHDTSLSLVDLFKSVSRLLTEQAHFYCILPANSGEVLALAAEHGLYCQMQTWVSSSPAKPPIRQLLRFGFSQNEPLIEHITIHNYQGTYSDEYVALCRDFYLNF